MKTATKEKRNGIQWMMLTQLDDLDFADDLALQSHSHWQMQDKTTELALVSERVGLKINKRKTKILRTNATCETPIMLEGETLDEVKDFKYLGSVVDTHGGTVADVKKRISKARVALHLLRNVWKSKLDDFKELTNVPFKDLIEALQARNRSQLVVDKSSGRLDRLGQGLIRLVRRYDTPDSGNSLAARPLTPFQHESHGTATAAVATYPRVMRI
ncbi:hypothetical protein LSAT2_002611 [Lamellibrachia satsuma]|nr:hypothetical protein LSAT2_002611 [Lamellibrachia satsuma]